MEKTVEIPEGGMPYIQIICTPGEYRKINEDFQTPTHPRINQIYQELLPAGFQGRIRLLCRTKKRDEGFCGTFEVDLQSIN